MLKVVGASWSQIRLSSWIIGIVILLGIVAIIVTETGISNDDGNYSATVYWTEELGYAIDFWGQGNKLEEIPKGVARAHYDPHITETGWAIFQVETQPEFSDQTQAYAAGLLEGALTWQMIYWHWLNTVNSYCEDKQLLCDSIRRFLKTNKDWAWKTAKDRREDPYWHQVYLYYVQLAGIENGYQQGVKRSRQDVEEVLSTDFLWMNMFSDLEDLEQAFSNNLLFMESLNYSSAEEWIEQKREKKLDTFNCGYRQIPLSSAFVKILPETGKLFVGHNSAGPYSRMLKMMKRYSLPYHHSDEPDSPLVSGTNLVFSSYPAAIHSMDDFYVISGSMGHNLVVAATPLPVYNEQLWQHVSETNTLLLGPRSLASNRLGRDSGNWASIFNHYNSGTGNKAWFVVNMGHFEKVLADTSNTNRLASLKNLLWVVEQIPGKIEASDVTEALLSSTYWAGYGIPYHNSIFNKSGALLMANEHGSAFSYNETALAKIFRRDQANVTSMDSAVNLMRSNLYRVDPLSEGNPRCAVGSRGDVSSEAEAAEPEGVTDIKVIRADAPIPYALKAALHNSTERVLWKTPRLRIAAGPVFGGTTTDGELDDLEPFSWSLP